MSARHYDSLIIDSGNTLKYLVETTFNYPTMAAAYRAAAPNGLNRVF